MDVYSVKSSGYIATSKAVLATGGALHSVTLLSDASHVATLTMYDNASAASGTILATLSIPASTTAPQTLVFNNPIVFNNGLYASITGTSANCIVHYSIG